MAAGVQLNVLETETVPVAPANVAPAGNPEAVRRIVSPSPSVDVTLKLKAWPTVTDWAGTGWMAGG